MKIEDYISQNKITLTPENLTHLFVKQLTRSIKKEEIEEYSNQPEIKQEIEQLIKKGSSAQDIFHAILRKIEIFNSSPLKFDVDKTPTKDPTLYQTITGGDFDPLNFFSLDKNNNESSNMEGAGNTTSVHLEDYRQKMSLN